MSKNKTVTPINADGLTLLLKKVIKFNDSLIIKGAPGIGKTTITENVVVNDLGYDFLPMYPAISSPTDFQGQPIYDKDLKRAMFVPYGNLERLITANKPLVVLLDDFGHAPQSVQAACMHLLSERRIGDNKVSDHVVFILATNDKGQQSGINGIIEPVKSRPVSIVELMVDVDCWVKWAIANKLRPEVIGFIRFRPELLHAFEPTSDLTNSPSPRTCAHVSRVLEYDLPDSVRFAAIEGAAGSGFAYEFAGFLKIFKEIASPYEILKNPETIDIPYNNPSILFAYCSVLASMATKETLPAIITFANRLPPEYAVKLIAFDVLSKDPKLAESKPYIDWVVGNQELLAA